MNTPLTPLQSGIICYAIADINAVHVDFWCQHTEMDAAPFHKLLSKVRSYAKGELSSIPNLQRFQQSLFEWQQSWVLEDNLACRIAEQSTSALYSSVEHLLDDDCDDILLLMNAIEQTYQEMASLEIDTTPLSNYWQEILDDLTGLLAEARRPITSDFFRYLQAIDTSLYGAD